MLTFDRYGDGRRDRISVSIGSLIIAGWTGRDEAAIRHHIEELAAIGVPRPSSAPVYYRVSADLLTQSPKLVVLGGETSGEVEPVVLSLADGLWIGLGSDHTDRKAEAVGVALSKQLCGKPIATALWRLEDITPHWDQLTVRAWATIGGVRTLYQEGSLAALRTPRDLIGRRPDEGELPPATLMFCGTVPAIGGIRPATRFEMQLEDPVLGRRIEHAYDVDCLPVAS
jgi:hypothetical protein